MRSNSKSIRLKWWLISISLIVGAAFGITWVVQTTSDATVAAIEVQVASKALVTPVKNVAAIEVGERISDLNLSAAAARITQLPQVRSANVERRWPDRIVISVDLREPIGWLRFGGEIWYLDNTGEKYQPKVTAAKPGLPLFEAASDRLLLASTRSYEYLPNRLKNRLSKVTAPTTSNIRFILTSGVTIIWGSEERSARKAEVLNVLLQRKAEVYDVSAPDLPTIRLK